ncbi:unnamed protein product [Effrenium voratum]|uniref:Uncharacterized protein n=1 Tax=Effrenium voratum TaxID=2562239 RepID=A0AA36JJE4_9DINO|nr:unnamed protein product [Effrenium voratum]
MDQDDLIDAATDAGMKKDDRKKLLQVVDSVRAGFYDDPASMEFVRRLEESGLCQYKGHFPDVQKLLGMDQDDLIDAATDAGMKKDDRKKLLQVVDSVRAGFYDDPASMEFVRRLEESGLCQYKGHFPDVQKLLGMDQDDLIDAATDAGMKKDDRKKLLQVVDSVRAGFYDDPASMEFVRLLEESGLCQYKGHFPDVQKLLGMDQNDLIDAATDAGMKKDDRKKLLQVVDSVRAGFYDDPASMEFVRLLEESGLCQYKGHFPDVQKLLGMDQDDLIDAASEAGMKKDDRPKFWQLLDSLKSRLAAVLSASGYLTEVEPSSELLCFLSQKSLEKYAQKMCRQNPDYAEVKLLTAMASKDLVEVAVDCGFAKEDRQKLVELVREELSRAEAAPSIGGMLAREFPPLGEHSNNLRVIHVSFALVAEKRAGLTRVNVQAACDEIMPRLPVQVPRRHFASYSSLCVASHGSADSKPLCGRVCQQGHYHSCGRSNQCWQIYTDRWNSELSPSHQVRREGPFQSGQRERDSDTGIPESRSCCQSNRHGHCIQDSCNQRRPSEEQLDDYRHAWLW